MLPTTEKLAQALEEKNDPKLTDMISKAREGYYDEYKSTISMPIFQLVTDLRNAGYQDLVIRTLNGEFDATSVEADAWMDSIGKAFIIDSVKGE